eukprot:scaffold220144_cov18-Tisochrysis_lutea.AAC.1
MDIKHPYQCLTGSNALSSASAYSTGVARFLHQLTANEEQLRKSKIEGRRGNGFTAVPAYVGNVAEAKTVPVTKPDWSLSWKSRLMVGAASHALKCAPSRCAPSCKQRANSNPWQISNCLLYCTGWPGCGFRSGGGRWRLSGNTDACNWLQRDLTFSQ